MPYRPVETHLLATSARWVSHASVPCLFLFCDPGVGADFHPAEEGAIATLHLHWFGTGQEELTGKVGTKAAVLQPSLDDATLKDAALAVYCQAQLVGAGPACA